MNKTVSNRKSQLIWYRAYIKRLWQDEEPEVMYYYDHPLCFVMAERIECAKRCKQARDPYFQGAVTHCLIKRCESEMDEADLQLLRMSWEIYYNQLCRDITTIAEMEQVWSKAATYLRWYCYQPNELDILGYDQRLFANRYRTLSIFHDFMEEWRKLINLRIKEVLSNPLLGLDLEQFMKHKKKIGLPIDFDMPDDSVVWDENGVSDGGTSQIPLGRGSKGKSPKEMMQITTYEDMFDLSYIEDLYKRYKTRIDEVVSIVGRTSDDDSSEKSLVSQMLQYQFPKPPYEDIDGITTGADLLNVIPSELPSLCSPDTDVLFYQKYVSQQLQSFSSFSKEDVKKISTVAHVSHDKGPIIISIDTSGSMSGYPYDFARLMVIRIYEMAVKQNRPMFLIEFSVQAKWIDLSGENGLEELSSFLCERYIGGTDGEEMFWTILKQLETENFHNADVVIVSDFDFELCLSDTLDNIHTAQSNGTRFYGINPTNCDGNPEYESVMDKIWRFYN